VGVLPVKRRVREAREERGVLDVEAVAEEIWEEVGGLEGGVEEA